MLRAPTPGSAFHRHRGRLALFLPPREVKSYWNDYWRRDGKIGRMLEAAERGELGEYEDVFTRYLRPDRLTLEAGCGPAQIVLALHRRGYRVAGVDLDRDVLGMVHERMPELDVRQGDVFHLDLPDGSLGAYISLGVVEHFVDGPGAILREARRVLAKDGLALVSVPFLNPARARHLGRARECTNGLDFYQYYFEAADFARELAAAGLQVIEEVPLFVESHLTRDHGVFSRFWNSRANPERLRVYERRAFARFTSAPAWLRRPWAHMLLYVCRPI